MGLWGCSDGRLGGMTGRDCDDWYTRLYRCVCNEVKEVANCFFSWG